MVMTIRDKSSTMNSGGQKDRDGECWCSSTSTDVQSKRALRSWDGREILRRMVVAVRCDATPNSVEQRLRKKCGL
ncbi:hypothetical protein ACOSP7_030848 [Xanthoceras sorbifolium]